MRRLVIVHDLEMPLEHPVLDVLVGIDQVFDDLIELRQGNDRIVMPIDHAMRVNAALSELLSAMREL